jgi:peptidoglycan-N-acetylglucosamine deacetylase
MSPPLIITTSWDDGHPLDMRLAEMLARNGLRATFYVPKQIETGVMSDAQVRELASNPDFEIGAHTLNHVFLTEVDDASATSEIDGSKKWVEDVTGRACAMFCPPAGKFTSAHVPMFRSAGFDGIRTVELASLDAPRKRGGYVEMPTTLQSFPHPASAYLRNSLKRRVFGNFGLYLRYGLGRNWTAFARRVIDHASEAGGVLHLWGHSWEIEQTAQWGPLDEVLRAMGVARNSANATCLTNGQVCQETVEAAAGAVGAPPEAMASSSSSSS